LTLGGTILGAFLAEPRAFGITALTVIGLLLIVWSVTHSPRLSWLLVFGLVAGGAGTLGRLGACSLLPFTCL
jgi:hypothetical protein